LARFRLLTVVLAVSTTVGLLALLAASPPPRSTLLWRAASDTGHAPLFGIIALAILAAMLAIHPASGKSRIRVYGLAMAAAGLLGAATEWLQFVGPRDADPWDAARDVLGAAAFLIVAASIDPGVRTFVGSRERTAMRLAAATCLAIALLPLAEAALAYADRRAAFPRLCSYRGWASRFVEVREVGLTSTALPERWGESAPSTEVARVFFSATPYPRVMVTEPWPDWTGYEALTLTVWSDLGEAVDLYLGVEDEASIGPPHDRFDRGFAIVPGSNRIVLPLDEIRRGPRGRFLDLGRVRGLVLYARGPERPFTVHISTLRLENDAAGGGHGRRSDGAGFPGGRS